MTVLAVLSQKGGSGKSTLAINLAAAFGAQSQRVMILDADPQGSVSAWPLLPKMNCRPESRSGVRTNNIWLMMFEKQLSLMTG